MDRGNQFAQTVTFSFRSNPGSGNSSFYFCSSIVILKLSLNVRVGCVLPFVFRLSSSRGRVGKALLLVSKKQQQQKDREKERNIKKEEERQQSRLAWRYWTSSNRLSSSGRPVPRQRQQQLPVPTAKTTQTTATPRQPTCYFQLPAGTRRSLRRSRRFSANSITRYVSQNS